MTRKICRTCLKKSLRTYKTHEYIQYPGESEEMKISDMLRYLVPELYLGVTTNPQLCADCRSLVRSAYAFRRKCLTTENIIGSYLKKSKCNAVSIELIDVLIHMEKQKNTDTKTENKDNKSTQNDVETQVKAQEIISEWDDDASQDCNHTDDPIDQEVKPQDPPETEKPQSPRPSQKPHSPRETPKELVLSQELGVFVDKFGNCYNADGVSIGHPDAIQNAQTDFLQIADVFSLNEDEMKNQSDDQQRTKPSDDQSNTCDNKLPRITIIPEAKNSFTANHATSAPSTPSAKTDLIRIRPLVPKIIHVKSLAKPPRLRSLLKVSPTSTAQDGSTPHINVIPERVPTPPCISATPEAESEVVKPVMPIIVDVRSESEFTEQSNPISEKTEVIKEPSTVEIKEEPAETYTDGKQDDEETITASEGSSLFEENISNIIDNIPDNDYVDIPEFVQINSFSLKDLDELKQRQQKQQQQLQEPPQLQGQLQQQQQQLVDSVGSAKIDLAGLLKNLKPLPPILPKPEAKKSQNLADQIITIGTGKNKKKIVAKIVVGESGTMVQSTDRTSASQLSRVNEVLMQVIKKHPRKCFVPRCPNSTKVNPKKIFVVVPKEKERRNRWFEAMGVAPANGELFVCEDHFNLEEDMENWDVYKLLGGSCLKKMRDHVTPHRYLTSPIPPEMIGQSQMTEVGRKRKGGEYVEELDSKVQKLEAVDSVFTEVEGRNGSLGHQLDLRCNAVIPDLPSKPLIIRKGKRIKLVPVDPDTNQKEDVCVLFTNYTWDGVYINDHDYLVTPYKRNKVLKNVEGAWLCMCFICGVKHPLYEHVEHMKDHKSYCEVCNTCFGTSYMLNMHVRFHTKKCHLCSQRLLYSNFKEHEGMHLKKRLASLKKLLTKRRSKEDEKNLLKANGDLNEETKTNKSDSEETDESSQSTATTLKLMESALKRIESSAQDTKSDTGDSETFLGSTGDVRDGSTQLKEPSIKLVKIELDPALNKSVSTLRESVRKKMIKIRGERSKSDDSEEEPIRKRSKNKGIEFEEIDRNPRVLRSRSKKDYNEDRCNEKVA